MKEIKFGILSLFFFVMNFDVSAQNTFDLISNKKNTTISFKLVNNLILLPVTLNGKEMTFMVDTGVKRTLLFNVLTDSLNVRKLKKIKIKGLGKDASYNALMSKSNLLRIKDIVCPNFELLVILKKDFDFSARLGTNVDGIIGSDLFKNFIVDINYTKKTISFTKPANYRYKKCKKCHVFPLSFHHQKPYIEATIFDSNKRKTKVKLLIDSGSGESVWLFDKSSPNIEVPNKNFDSFLGKGLSGDIFGKKAKLRAIEIGTYRFNDLIVAYPDSTSIIGNNITFKRNGILGSEILKRFHITFDYPNKKIRLKKNKKYYKSPFYYDKSGLDIIYNGKILVRVSKTIMEIENTSLSNNEPVYTTTETHLYVFKKSYIIDFVKVNSPAAHAGLLKNDLIININGTEVYGLTLQEIFQKLSSKTNTTIRLTVQRDAVQMKFKFKLESLL